MTGRNQFAGTISSRIVLKRDSSLASQEPRFRIKSNESVKPRGIKQCAPIIQATVPVAAAFSIRENWAWQSIQIRDFRSPRQFHNLSGLGFWVSPPRFV